MTTPDREDLLDRALAAGLGSEDVKLWEHRAAELQLAEVKLQAKLQQIARDHVAIRGRLALLVLAGSVLFDLLDPAVLLLATPESLVYLAAAATRFGPDALARIFGGLAVLLLPFLALQCGLLQQRARGVTQLACVALALAAVLWIFLAWASLPLGLGVTPLIFFRSGVGALLFALALAWSLNAEQIRSMLERP